MAITKQDLEAARDSLAQQRQQYLDQANAAAGALQLVQQQLQSLADEDKPVEKKKK